MKLEGKQLALVLLNHDLHQVRKKHKLQILAMAISPHTLTRSCSEWMYISVLMVVVFVMAVVRNISVGSLHK